MRLLKRLGLALGLGAALWAGHASAQQQFVNVLTGGQSGVYYPLGVSLSQIFAKDIPNARSTAQVTRASAENLNLLQARPWRAGLHAGRRPVRRLARSPTAHREAETAKAHRG